MGREHALAGLRHRCAAAGSGHGCLVAVVGEAGIGKTALVASVTAEAARDGALVLWGQCWNGAGAPPYWPWVQVLRAGAEAGGCLGAAARLLPERTGAAPPADMPGEVFELHDAVARQLSALASERLVVVVLDDLHRADDASLALVEFCERHLQTSSVLLLMTYRDDEASEQVRRAVAGGQMLPLGGLTPDAVGHLVRAVSASEVSPELAQTMWSRTGGNPFFVGEVVRLLAGTGCLGDASAARAVVPASVREVLERRLARLPQPCVDALTVAAVAAPEIRADVLHRVLDVDLDRVRVLLDDALEAHVLVPPGSPSDGYRFSHDLFRETLLHSTPVPVRARLHLALGRALEAARDAGAPVHAAELAAHFSAAGADAVPDAVAYSLLAGQEATARSAFDDACSHYEQALAALDAGGGGIPQDRIELLLLLGDARARAGAGTQALLTYQAAAASGSGSDPEQLARAAVGVHALGARGSHAASIALLEQALRALPAVPSPLRARVLACLAREQHHSWAERDRTRGRVLAEQAVADARELQDPGTQAFCLLALHDATWRPGTGGERLEIVAQMLVAAEDSGDAELAAQSLLLRATAHLELGDAQAVRELAAYCRACDELGHARARYGALSRRATLALLAGELDEAERTAEEACQLGLRIGEPDAAGVRETLLWAAGRLDPSRLRTLGLDSDPWPGLPLGPALVELGRGEVTRARALLAPLRLEALPQTYDLEVLAFAAAAFVAAGSPEQQDDLYERLVPHAGTHVVVGGCAAYHGAVDHHLGLLARARGREDAARAHFTAAAGMHDQLGAPAWAEASRAEAHSGHDAVAGSEEAVFRRTGSVWQVRFAGREAHLPDAKGLHDVAVLLARPAEPVSAVELQTGRAAHDGADAVLDEPAKRAYRRRLAELEAQLEDAEADHDLGRAEKARGERDALVAELASAVGLRGRDRRLGDDAERARKAVTARIRDALAHVERAHPQCGAHLRAAVQTGSWCVYVPAQPTRWRL